MGKTYRKLKPHSKNKIKHMRTNFEEDEEFLKDFYKQKNKDWK